MSRTMQQQNKDKGQEPAGGTPMWVGFAYALGIFAAVILVLLVVLSVGPFPVTAHVSAPVIALWIVLGVFAGGLFLYRRRR